MIGTAADAVLSGPCVLLMAPSGAWKPTLAEQLARGLGAAVVNGDAYKRRMPARPASSRGVRKF